MNTLHLKFFLFFLKNYFRQFQNRKYRLLDSLVVKCWLRVREVPGSIPSQGPHHTEDVVKMVPVVPLFSTEHSKGEILALSEELRLRSLAIVAGMKKPNDHAEPTKVER